ncbi:hypothetical protein SPRG_12010 [Saprolegnia parasitica CBS 223.65]|uniref:GDT1 family protein n=1 Tax=Saprolegnia parasitica (strain CBS 223.65) TaxID=695850 RepID=A0A067BX75_SAPPC|nr:hypothetical protein SPRG_12010 [Saprolegnia parasitica CBS 223.65]KDO22873.1 hypothetical protein SPRG_12010 [Saprolegnia parasitica CBS 223.65]|eukprot:XP_012206429.1 hypothetical protein SPRG_12010 [Saprolegnia parasitica CBS 223.65]
MKASPVLLLLLLTLVSVVGQRDAFDAADEDHDGVLQRREFDKWSARVRDAIDPLLAPGSGVKPVAASNPDRNDDANNTGLKRVKNKVNKFWSGFMSGIITIWATEVGDKTFFIAAILSMKHDRIVVFAGAIGALIVMTVLSVVLGGVAAFFLPPRLTHYAGAFLAIVRFGPSEELTEVEEELEGKKNAEDVESVEGGAPIGPSSGTMKVFSQAFFLTFLAEWGDRSQIATITLAAANDAFGVTLGAILGHSMCTGLAVVGGKLLASRISEKTVTVVGGVLFLLFALHSLVFGPEE